MGDPVAPALRSRNFRPLQKPSASPRARVGIGERISRFRRRFLEDVGGYFRNSHDPWLSLSIFSISVFGQGGPQSRFYRQQADPGFLKKLIRRSARRTSSSDDGSPLTEHVPKDIRDPVSTAAPNGIYVAPEGITRPRYWPDMGGRSMDITLPHT